MTEIILAAMLTLIPTKAQERHGEAAAAAAIRYAVVADAVADAANGSARMAALLLTVAKHESSLRREVHTGKIRGDGGRSWGLWQVLCGKAGDACPRTELEAFQLVGVDAPATRIAAGLAAQYLRAAGKRCRWRSRCIFMAYGGVSKTTNLKVRGRIDARVKTYRFLRAFFASRATQ